MIKLPKDRYFTGLDIGTTKVACVIANRTEEGKPNVIGVGVVPSDGINRGVIQNIEKATLCVQEAIERAEKMAGVKVEGVFAGISGEHINIVPSAGMVALPKANRDITREDVERVMKQAETMRLPADEEILHVIPRKFIVDGKVEVEDPVGMIGTKLEVKANIITGATAAIQNVRKVVERAGYKLYDIVLQPLASAASVLQEDELIHGVVLVDIGGGTTDVAIFTEGSIAYASIIPWGGDSITNDIALGLKTSRKDAEKLKIEYGVAARNFIKDDSVKIRVPGIGGRKDKEIPIETLIMIIEARVDEILGFVNEKIENSGLRDFIGAGAVITGGTANLPGIADLAEARLDLHTKVGVPREVAGLKDAVDNPALATAVGLVLHAMEEREVKREIKGASILERIKKWFEEIF
ncbi:cell division protein FtsA [bacterium]|nr:MAG: cell division protein FtsA [bacterium]